MLPLLDILILPNRSSAVTHAADIITLEPVSDTCIVLSTLKISCSDTCSCHLTFLGIVNVTLNVGYGPSRVTIIVGYVYTSLEFYLSKTSAMTCIILHVQPISYHSDTFIEVLTLWSIASLMPEVFFFFSLQAGVVTTGA